MTNAPRIERVEVAVVGGGLAGSAVAARLAAAGRSVVVFERAPAWRWQAGGVFASPAAVDVLARLGLGREVLEPTFRRIPAMRVESPDGEAFRLTYGDDGSLARSAVGFDRQALDALLETHALAGGAEIRRGANVVACDPAARRLDVRDSAGAQAVTARVIIGADGRHSVVARAVDAVRPVRLAPRIGLTWHLADPVGAETHDATMRLFRDGYVGIAPVPGGRVNVGVVLGPSWRSELARRGAAAVGREIAPGEPCDAVVGAWPLGVRARRRAGRGWLLVGDAAGFLDPFTGEGLHRALVSAELAAAAAERFLRGDTAALGRYDAAMRRRFATKDVVSLVVQAFLGRPRLFGYAARRLAGRDAVRETMGLVMGDLVPASRALDPRFLVALLRP